MIVTVAAIKEAVSKNFFVSIKDIDGDSRLQNIVQPRHIAMYLSRKMTSKSFPEIGTYFNGRDHTTVMSAYDKIDRMIKTDLNFKNIIDLLVEQIDNDAALLKNKKRNPSLIQKTAKFVEKRQNYSADRDRAVKAVVAATTRWENERFSRYERHAFRALEQAVLGLRKQYQESGAR